MAIRILVIGVDGKLGSGLESLFQDLEHDVFATTRRAQATDESRLLVNLADNSALWPLLPQVDVAIYCAGIIGFNPCLADPVGSARLNIAAPMEMAKLLAVANTRFIYLSSNAVFNGRQPFVPHDSPTCPLTEYGRQKAKAEEQLVKSMPDAAIIRLSKVLTPKLTSLLTYKRKLQAGEIVETNSDVFRAPITLPFAIKVIAEVLFSQARGIFHASGDEDIANDEFARIFANEIGADPSLVLPTLSNRSQEDLSPNTTLDMTREKEELGLQSQSSRAAIKWVANQLI